MTATDYVWVSGPRPAPDRQHGATGLSILVYRVILASWWLLKIVFGCCIWLFGL